MTELSNGTEDLSASDRGGYRMRLHPLLADRASTRAYDHDHKLEREDLRILLEAARWAPSSRNGQPWRFLAGRRGDDTFDGVLETLVESNQEWARHSAALICGIVQVVGDTYRTARYDLGLSVGHLVVQAGALGLHVRQMGGFHPEAVIERFGIPDGFEPVVVVAVGRLGTAENLPEKHRLREAEPRTRRSLEEIAFESTWGNPIL
jgi:nitroreductase